MIMLVFAALLGFTANAQTQKTTTSTTAKPATTTTQKPVATQAPKPAPMNVPSAVAAAFKTKYPTITAPSWKIKGTDYRANFKMANEEMMADFDATGKWLQTETKIATSSLPATVQSSIKKDFADYKTEDACKVQNATTGGYSAKVAKGTEKYEVVFGTDGKVISKTKV